MARYKGIIIDLIKQVKDMEKKEPLGYRVMYKGNTNSVPHSVLIETLQKSDCIANAKVEAGKIVGTQGAIERYPVITVANTVVKGGMTIVKKIWAN